MNMRETGDVSAQMRDIGIRARKAARVLSLAESAQKTNALKPRLKPSAQARRRFSQPTHKTSRPRRNRTSQTHFSIASRSPANPSMQSPRMSKKFHFSRIPLAK
jgi:hypothetical protein